MRSRLIAGLDRVGNKLDGSIREQHVYTAMMPTTGGICAVILAAPKAAFHVWRANSIHAGVHRQAV